jgi:hypothetical protein
MGLDPETRRIAIDLATRGYAVIEFPEPDFDALAESIKRDLLGEYDLAGWREAGHAQGISLRVQDAWLNNAQVKRIATNQVVLELLSKLYGKKAWPFQTLNFPVGTQQHYHSDSIHFSSNPERFMCGVWVALEDVDAENGPLMYFPGSHKWPIYANEHVGKCSVELDETPTQALYESMWEAVVEAHGAQPEYFHAKKGQALIWAANLMHGGCRQLDPQRTRWSQVTHYYFEDCAYYTPMLSDPFYGNVAFRELTNIVTGELMPHRYAGHKVPQEFVDAVTENHHWDPDFRFDAAEYLAANADVASAGVNPFEHYVKFGRKEKRNLRP